MRSWYTPFALVAALMAAATSSPLAASSALATDFNAAARSGVVVQRDVWAPRVTSPTTGTVWTVGTQQTITWDVTNPPRQITNPRGVILLSKDGLADVDHPLARNFPIRAGKQQITVPNVPPGSHYRVILIGSGDNSSPSFTIVRRGSKTSAAKGG
ncbi:Ser-Thr-rich GPI-anchored membrane family protein [Streptomyces sp. NPDC001941]|uniref:Ser-Thr-rich GPI-anchored membrane family protein n=1 Tax=Streptomyces sp. NPDC001941 TaxID=3154659 RepID=UPI003323A6CB